MSTQTTAEGPATTADKAPLRRGPLFIINTLFGSRYCHYGFQVDTFVEGCTHNCVYCYAKEEGERDNRWNNPAPKPVDLAAIRDTFETVFGTDAAHPWRPILERRVPLRIGGYSDCFIKSEQKFRVTEGLIRLLVEYRYPHVIVTRSTMAADDRYLEIMDPDLTMPQLSITSLNAELSRAMEPGAPAPELRVQTVERLAKAGFMVGVRCNPLFPIYPDGHYANGLSATADTPRFDYFSFGLIDAVAAAGAKSIIAGFTHLSPVAHAAVQKQMTPLGVDLSALLTPARRATGSFAISSREMRAYYERIRDICAATGMDFTTCYLGTGDARYREFDDLWANKEDCCAIKGCKPAFDKTAVDISPSQQWKASSPEMSWLARSARVAVGGMGQWLANQLAPGHDDGGQPGGDDER